MLFITASLVHEALGHSIFQTLLKDLTPLPLDSPALETFIIDSKRCSKDVRQEIIMSRNAPSLSLEEFGDMETEAGGKQPICIICQQVLQRPPSSTVSVWDTRNEDTPVKLVVAEKMSPPASHDKSPKDNQKRTPNESSKIGKYYRLQMNQCNASTPHAFHLGCIRSWFFGDKLSEMNHCQTCRTTLYKRKGGGRVWEWNYLYDEASGEYREDGVNWGKFGVNESRLPEIRRDVHTYLRVRIGRDVALPILQSGQLDSEICKWFYDFHNDYGDDVARGLGIYEQLYKTDTGMKLLKFLRPE